ncbi:hypothetical protein Slin14017_G032470 [Septoria linicola]|nr:hypothetical protein Slin14017_G032470 [Septoria linicola]
MDDQRLPNAATQVFHIPEVLELILLALPGSTTHQEIASHRTVLLCRTTSSTWHLLIKTSTLLRQSLYLPTPQALSPNEQDLTWHTKHAFPPCTPNSWIPILLLQQRSWGSAWPFELSSLQHDLQPTQPRLWTFSLEVSHRQYRHLATLDNDNNSTAWRNMLASSSPFTDFWATRTFYELGSGRAPFVQHLDYDTTLPKWKQKYYRHCPEGVTLGDLVDAVKELFEIGDEAGSGGTKFVMVESVRAPGEKQDGAEVIEDRPRERGYVPGM